MVDLERIEDHLTEVVQKRLVATEDERSNTISKYKAGDPLTAEDNIGRRRAASLRAENDMHVRKSQSRGGAEARKGPRDNFVPVSFLETGANSARSVARVSMFGATRTATGFLISPELFITNFHVIPTPEIADVAELQFEFETDSQGRSREATVFSLAPHRCFISDGVDGLDFTIVAVGEALSGPRNIEEFGFNPLSGSGRKHALGEFANIIQHPDGRPKEVVLQDNMIAGRHERALHYVADTEPGSSGAPVFNNAWQVIALHHWGEVKDPDTLSGDYDLDTVNEGIRISRIVANLAERNDEFHGEARQLVSRALELGTAFTPREVMRQTKSLPSAGGTTWRSNDDGTVTWQIPAEITLGISGLGHRPPATVNTSVPAKVEPTATPVRPFGPEARSLEELALSAGYDRNFLTGENIDLPVLQSPVDDQAVELFDQFRLTGRPAFELTYTHFSVVMNRERKIAMLTAVNIDGSRLFGLKRKTGERYLYDDNRAAIDPRIASEVAEGSSWFFDDRIPRDLQTGPSFYDKKNNNILIKAFEGNFKEKVDFQRGHIVRRLDPVWGTLADGLAADADSHAWPNVAPHTATFNANNRDAANVTPGEEKRLWAAAENAILRSAFDDRKRLTVFSGPVFSANDPVYAGLEQNGYQRRVPLAFWKVICWKGETGLRSLALLIDQSDTMTARPSSEALDDPSELLALKDFLTTVPKLEQKIHMRFGDNVREADVWRRNKDVAVADMSAEQFLSLVRS